MPSRGVCGLILLFWLVSIGWMFERDWLPWLRATDEAPPFVFELADEVVYQYATWGLTRNGKRIGLARTSLQYQRDNTFEWVQTLSNLDYNLSVGAFTVEALLPKVETRMIVNPKGQLQRFVTNGEIVLKLAGTEFKATMELTGVVDQNQIRGECVLKSALGTLKEPFGPHPLKSNNVFSPLQPLFRIGGLTPGKRWRMNDYNPISEAFRLALEQIVKKATRDAKGREGLAFPIPQPGTSEILATVLPELQTLTWKEQPRRCYVIEYRTDELVARTWVDSADGMVIQQEAYGSGEKLVLERD